jgi:hypothetical protein
MAGLLIPDYPDPQDPGATIPAAVAWIESLHLDAAGGTGRVTLRVYRSAQAAETPGAERVRTVEYVSGQGVIPPLAELMAEPEFAAAYGVIAGRLYELIAGRFPGAEVT